MFKYVTLKNQVWSDGSLTHYWSEVRRCFCSVNQYIHTLLKIYKVLNKYVMFPDFILCSTVVVKNIHQVISCCSLQGIFDLKFIFILSLYADFLFGWWAGTGFLHNPKLSLIQKYINVMVCRITLLQCFCWTLDEFGTKGVHNHSGVIIKYCILNTRCFYNNADYFQTAWSRIWIL
jgi:hypothetical protein